MYRGMIIIAGIGLEVLWLAGAGWAQINPDGSLGSEASRLVPDALIHGDQGILIEGGALRDTLLFHSFSDFNVLEQQRVYFSNPTGISDIIGRVTGSNPSQILGLLGVEGSANLWLVNPNGILFGANAQLDIAGSFTASTADYLALGQGNHFSATQPNSPPLLTINLPRPTLPVQITTGTITTQGSLSTGANLTLAAHRLDVQNSLLAGENLNLLAIDTIQVRDTAAQPTLLAAGANLAIQGDRHVEIVMLDHPQSSLFSGGDMRLRSASPINGDAHYFSRGSFRVETLEGQLGILRSPIDPVISALGDIQFDAYIGASLKIIAGGSVTIPSGVFITGTGPVPSICPTPCLEIYAGVDPSSPLFATNPPTNVPPFPPGIINPSLPTATPSSADITLGAVGGLGLTNVLLTNQTDPNPMLSGDIQITGFSGFGAVTNGGNVDIQSRRDVVISNAESTVGGLTGQPGGRFAVSATRDISITNSPIDSTSRGGTGQDITLQAGNHLTINNSFIHTHARIDTLQGGSVLASARSIQLLNGALLSASTDPALGSPTPAQGGDVIVNASESLIAVGTAPVGTPFAGLPSGLSTGTNRNGLSGSITVNTPYLQLKDGAVIYAGTTGNNAGGDITIDSSVIDIQGTSAGTLIPLTLKTVSSIVGTSTAIFTAGDYPLPPPLGSSSSATPLSAYQIPSSISTDSTSGGDAGSIQIRTNTLTVSDGGMISSSSGANGNGGTIAINAKDDILLSGQSSSGNFRSGIFAASGGSGNSGQLSLEADRFIMTNGSIVTTNAYGTGVAGELVVRAQTACLDFLSSIESAAASGNGGNQTFDLGQILVLRNGSALSATAGTAFAGGNGGNIDIRSPFIVGIPQENSDITANAYSGSGGRITITTQGIVGLEFRPVLTPLSDITASSTLGVSGEVIINGPRIELGRDPVLPTVDPGVPQLAQGCGFGQTFQTDRFSLPGQGGLPTTPTQVLETQSIGVPFIEMDEGFGTATVTPEVPRSSAGATGLELPSSPAQLFASCVISSFGEH